MAGDWTTDDLAGVLSAFAANMRELVPEMLHRLRHAVLSRMPQSHDNTIEGARENIHHHYDLSNALFKTFLDESMTYSSAIFNGEPYGSDEDLADAQRRKIDRLLDSAAVGTGHPAARDRNGLGRARDPRRAPRARRSRRDHLDRAGRAGPRTDRSRRGDRPRRRDCRTTARCSGTYDAIVSVEMIEAVGANHWPTYFRTIDRALAPGGRVGAAGDPAGRLHGARHARHLHVDPQVHLPRRAARVGRGDRPHDQGHTALRIADRYSFGRHYAETLRRWRARFEEQRSSGRRSASTRRSGGCGRSTSPTPRPASAPATSTSRSSPSPSRSG